MPVPFEGTTSLPKDAGNLAFGGLWDGSNFYAPRGQAGVAQVGGSTVIVTGSVTRPANTNDYAAGEVIGLSSGADDIITLAGCARVNGGSGLVIDGFIVDQGGAAAAAALELYLFTQIPTPQIDQALLELSNTDINALVGIAAVGASFVTNTGAGTVGSRVYPLSNLNWGFRCAAGSEALYAVLVVRALYAPVSGEAFAVWLKISQD